MKAYTDIEQSKKLAEILPLETADMAWEKHTNAEPHVTVKPWTTKGESIGAHVLPCWSLAALLDVLPISIDDGRHCLALINSNPLGKIEWLCCYEDDNGNLLMECYADNQVDACVEMLLKLKEEDLI